MVKYTMEDYAAKARQAVGEGIVLLRNEDNVLPLKQGSKVAVFGRSQFNYYKSGTGSGGMVNTSYVIGILDALEADKDIELNQNLKEAYKEWLKDHPFDAGIGWASEPWFQEEMPLSEKLVDSSSKESDIAIIIIGRTAGEDKDNKAEAGSYLLTQTEEDMLDLVCKSFDSTIVLLNTGNIIDMKWVDKYMPSAVAYVWQGGQEGGNAVLDVLKGRVNPSGKLPDTIAYDINDYPSTKNFGNEKENIYEEDIYVGYRYFETFAKDRVMYPFGFGLSYTSFDIELVKIDMLEPAIDKTGTITVKVTNTGDVPGKEVVQVYSAPPQGVLGKPARTLCGFAKTNQLLPSQSQILDIQLPWYYLASYDDAGKTGFRSSYVLEAGEYEFYLGSNVRSASLAASVSVAETVCLQELEEALAPIKDFKVLTNKNGEKALEPVKTSSIDLNKRVQDNMPITYEMTGDKGYKLSDTVAGKLTMEEFIAQLDDQDLACIVRGEGMSSPKGTPGTAGVFGGVTQSLLDKGIPIACCADGPSGIRMDTGTLAFSLPNGTCLASSFNEDLNRELYEWEALELRKNKIDALLGPGMNIHRNPLNGRNFEYFSEDPLLTGKMAAAQLKGLHKYDVTGVVKHFACNNQEYMRNDVETVISERAVREIYLKAFEIGIKEGKARAVMSTYAPINGYWTASNYDLLTTILRGEWGFNGIVMTDWWAKGNFEGEEGKVSNVAAKVRAQNDLDMVNEDALSNSGKDNSIECMESGRVSRGEYQRTAMNICNFIITTPAFQRMIYGESDLDRELIDFKFEDEKAVTKEIICIVDGDTSIAGSEFDTSRGAINLLNISLVKSGIYRIEITCRARQGEEALAQIPITIAMGSLPLGVVSLKGSQKEWKTHVIDIEQPIPRNNYHIKVVFGQGGAELKDLRIVLVDSLDDN